jgi:hypothetical protein
MDPGLQTPSVAVRQPLRPVLARLLATTLLLASMGCGDKTLEPTPPATPATLVLSPTRVTLTARGQTAQFVALVTGARDMRVSWASSDSAVVRVQSGSVEAVATGTAVIRATLVTDPSIRDSGAVVVVFPTNGGGGP